MKSIILFFHPQCKACQRLLSTIKDKSGITFINIYEEEVKYNITSVPCIILDKSKMLVGKQCFELFEAKKELRCVNTKRSVGFSEISTGKNSEGMFDLHCKLGQKNGADGVRPTDDDTTELSVEELIRKRDEGLN
jgi:hypothetical protein